MIFRYNTLKKTCVVVFPKIDKIEKIFLNNKAETQNEFDGNYWYLKNLNKKNKKLDIKYHNSYLSVLNLPFYKGRQIKFWQNIEINLNFILRVIDHYKEVWPDQKYVPFHGDLTLSNVIFGSKKEDVTIIDWETFRKKKYLWGLDICYFLISVIALPALSRKNKSIFKDEKKIFFRLWKNFFYKKKFEYLKSPFEYISKKNLVKSNNFIYQLPKKTKKEILELIKLVDKDEKK
tara:strand:+ start:138 stop:836 length:699 start_codon:yes stop_codon:yes gene_type:complete